MSFNTLLQPIITFEKMNSNLAIESMHNYVINHNNEATLTTNAESGKTAPPQIHLPVPPSVSGTGPKPQGAERPNMLPAASPLVTKHEDLPSDGMKRKREDEQGEASSETKKVKTEVEASSSPLSAVAGGGGGPPSPTAVLLKTDADDSSGPAPVLASKEGTSVFGDNDVLSGRGGGTNVHPGNRNFRDLINMHRRAYLKARKNDKPAISRAIVRSIREKNGAFLKKDEKTGLWYEIGDDAAREKTSQALRQRAPEMRKLLFDTEREEARAVAEEHLRQQRMLMGMPADAAMMQGMQAGMQGMQNLQGQCMMAPMAAMNPAAMNPAAMNPAAMNPAAMNPAAGMNPAAMNPVAMNQMVANNPQMAFAAANPAFFAMMNKNGMTAMSPMPAAAATAPQTVMQQPQQQQQQQQQQQVAQEIAYTPATAAAPPAMAFNPALLGTGAAAAAAGGFPAAGAQ